MRERQRPMQGDGVGRKEASDKSLLAKQEKILAVPELHPLITPNPTAEEVARNIAVSAKVDGPEFKPLLIYVVGPSLIRECRRKQNEIAQFHQIGDEGLRPIKGQVLGNSNRYREPKSPGNFNSFGQIAGMKLLWIDE